MVFLVLTCTTVQWPYVPTDSTVPGMERSCSASCVDFLFVQDAFTDMSISVRKMNVDVEPYCNMKTYVHMGMHATAVTIHNMLFENEVLQLAFEKFPVSSIRFHWNNRSCPVLAIVTPCSMLFHTLLLTTRLRLSTTGDILLWWCTASLLLVRSICV